MIQQINLYQDRLKDNQTKPVLNKYIYGLLLAVILLIGFSIHLVMDVNQTKRKLQQAKQQLLQAETQVKLLQIKFPKQQINTLLTQEITHTQNVLTSLSQVVHILNDKKSDQTQGFSRYFSALARQSITDVWLSNISINSQQHSIELQGSTFNPDKIPVLLQKLHHEAVFQGRHFEKLIMSQAKEPENQIDFTIGTTVDIAEQENDG